jgi:hypothetical protein
MSRAGGFRPFIGAALIALVPGVLASPAGAAPDSHDHDASPPHHVRDGATASYQSGYQPTQVRHAYGFDGLSCAGSTSTPDTCGSGQTIAIVDAYDDPNIASDLAAFDTQFGLPAASLTKATPQGLPQVNGNWSLEISLDVEWAHAIAPGAQILLVEAASNSFTNLLGAVDYAVGQGAHVVSMSWGGGEFSGETAYDGHFQAAGVTFTASSGDNGTGVLYPASSPWVTSVGGTTLPLDASGNLTGSETAWSGTGGGVSTVEREPGYQSGYPIPSAAGGHRGVPDVAYDADPNTGFAVYDTVSYFGQRGWWVIGGTSAGAPQWAALTAIADAQRSAGLATSLTSSPFYQAATGAAYAADYRDITIGSNGSCGAVCTAGPGYDFVTGLGSPLSGALVAALAGGASGGGTTGTLTYATAPQSLTAGSPSGTITVTLSPAAPAGGATLALSSTSPSGTFSTSPAPFTPTTTVAVPAGATTASFYYEDTAAGSPTIGAAATGYTAASQTLTVNPGPLATITISPGSASVVVGGTQPFSAAGADQWGNSVSVSTATWAVSAGLGTLSPGTGSSTTLTAGSTTGSGSVTASVGTVSGSATVTVVTLAAPTGLTARARPGHINLNWTGVGGAASYDVYEGVGPSPSSFSLIGSVTSTSTGVFGVSAGTTYTFYVTAVSSTGAQSAPSNNATVTAR